MKRLGYLVLSVLLLFLSLRSEQKIAEFEKEIKQIKDIVSPSIVKVISENQKKYVATGIAISADLILTSTLITRHHYEKIYIQTVGGEHYDARILGKDRRYSLIVLKLKDKVMKPVKIYSKPDVGDWIALVGVFYDKFPSIIQGIVSSLSDEEMILNAPVFPGASGGAVVNKRGELVAVIRGRFGIAIDPDISIIDHQGELVLHGQRMQAKNLCYAVPSERVLEIANQIEKHGQVQRGWLGIFFQSNKGGRKGLITFVVKDSPAERAGLKKNDIIVSINGNDIQEYSEISRIVQQLPPGKEARFNIIRNHSPKTLTVKIGLPRSVNQYEMDGFRIRIPESSLIIPEFNGNLPQAQNFIFYRKGSRTLGIDVMELTPELADKFKIKEGFGLMIAKIYDKSAARKAGLEEGDIIVRANRNKMRTLSDIRKKLSELVEKEPILIEFYREGKMRSLSIEPEVIAPRPSGWNDFISKFHMFSRYLGDAFSTQYRNVFRRQLEALKQELSRLKAGNKKISGDELKRIEAEIDMVKKRLRESYSREMDRIQQEEKRIYEANRKVREEELRLLKEIEQIKKKIKEKTDKDDSLP
jgi:serine protease Do